MIAIIDYGMGNLRSVEKGFGKVGVDIKVTNRPEDVEKAEGVVLPGVGAFRDCMKGLKDLDMIESVKKSIRNGKPYLGICLGMQILFSESDEFGKCSGLDIFRGKVVRFDFGTPSNTGIQDSELIPHTSYPIPLKVPHMGWNEIIMKKDNPLFANISDKSYFYFVHSYYVVPNDISVIATTTDYGMEFTSSVWKDNVFAVQFHPEKSQHEGLQMLKNFGDIVKRGL